MPQVPGSQGEMLPGDSLAFEIVNGTRGGSLSARRELVPRHARLR